ncbi:TRAP transporter permease [Microbacterium esteraromaticum]|uniref:TRAP transporter large permease n=1 Tax=Microbacterium esteraromaticum TaxID=57043 RepID=UPI001CD2695C|nr:TRAP transporter large permease subunit [Microbacterium esteraromaticum]MCA1307851.1 TRAP transporter permease [Microbacterium esteraromaticum]
MTVETRIDAKASSSTRPKLDLGWKTWTLPAVLIASSALAIILLTSDMQRELKAAVAIGWMLVMLMLNVPVGAAMGIAGAVGILSMIGARPLAGLLGEIPFVATATSTMTVLPMFIFMGLILWRAEITADLYRAAKVWLAWLPGGLAVTSNIAGAGLGAASGSTMGIAYALGRIGIPEMLRAGYHRLIAVGSIMSSGTIAQLIPPSLLLVIYASFTEVPVGQQLLAGVVPGLLLTAAYCAIIVIVALIRPGLAPRSADAPVSWGERLKVTVGVWPVVGLVIVVIGGMSAGVFTATEAGAVGALVAVVFALIRKGVRAGLRLVVVAARDTLASVGSLVFVLIGAVFLNRFLALSGAAQWFSNVIGNAGLTALAFAGVVIVLYLVLGMFMDPIPMMLLTVPLLLPTAVELGFSPIWFGVFVVLLGEIAIMSPPVGVLTFVTHRIAQDPDVNLGQRITLGDVFKAGLIFIPGALAIVLLLVLFPGLGNVPALFR